MSEVKGRPVLRQVFDVGSARRDSDKTSTSSEGHLGIDKREQFVPLFVDAVRAMADVLSLTPQEVLLYIKREFEGTDSSKQSVGNAIRILDIIAHEPRIRQAELAERLGVTRQSVHNQFIAIGLIPPKEPETESERRIVELYEEGERSLVVMRKSTGLSRQTALNILYRTGKIRYIPDLDSLNDS